MNIHDRRGPRDLNRGKLELPAEQAAALRDLARKWRDEWRAEKTAAVPAPTPGDAPRSHPMDGGPRHRARFAKAMARAELGRAYWDERLHRPGIAANRASREGRRKKE